MNEGKKSMLKNPKNIVIIAAAAVVVILTVWLAVGNARIAEVKDDCAEAVFYAVYTLEERLEVIVSGGEYGAVECEKVLGALVRLDMAVKTAESFYSFSGIPSGADFTDLADALGCSYSAQHNDTVVASVLHDGEVSESELEFISALYTDISALLSPMLDEDGLKMREGLGYGDLRLSLAAFLDRWGSWSWSSDAPYELLDVVR